MHRFGYDYVPSIWEVVIAPHSGAAGVVDERVIVCAETYDEAARVAIAYTTETHDPVAWPGAKPPFYIISVKLLYENVLIGSNE